MVEKKDKTGPYKEDPFYWWIWPAELAPDRCQQLIDIGKDKWKTSETIGSHRSNTSPKGIRDSNVFWIKDQKVIDLIWPYMESANKRAGFNYDITAVESIQLTRYCKEGFYSWHMDGLGSHRTAYNIPNSKFLHGKTRKLSMTILLNSDFKGGHLKIYSCNPKQKTKQPDMSTGSIVVFPSFLFHRVTPITKGIRYSLVSWFVGPPFR